MSKMTVKMEQINITVISPTEGPPANLVRFSDSYAGIHGYVSVCVCIFGIVTNLFNVSVLTRKHMHSPVNEILTWLAVSDILTMTSYIPFAVHFYCQYPLNASSINERNSYGWMTFLVVHINVTITTHTISIWMCVVLAIVRYLHIRKPTKANIFRIRRQRQTRIIIGIVYVLSAIILIPHYLSNEIQKVEEENLTAYSLRDLKLGDNNTDATVIVNVWVYAMIAKIIPCCLMSVFGSILIYNIHVKIRKRRKVLQISGNNSIRLSEHSRTTTMLLTVIILFILTELPQGILIVLSACVNGFFKHVYIPLGDVMDIVALVNNGINFVLYCSMSTKFRQTFIKLYCGFCRRTQTRMESSFAIPMVDKGIAYDSHSNMLIPK